MGWGGVVDQLHLFTFASSLPWAPRSECGQDVTVALVVQPFGLSHRSQAPEPPAQSRCHLEGLTGDRHQSSFRKWDPAHLSYGPVGFSSEAAATENNRVPPHKAHTRGSAFCAILTHSWSTGAGRACSGTCDRACFL